MLDPRSDTGMPREPTVEVALEQLKVQFFQTTPWIINLQNLPFDWLSQFWFFHQTQSIHELFVKRPIYLHPTCGAQTNAV
jgi:hypothetical protein